MKKHFDISVHGKVQGVFFRQSTLEEALSLGLTGFVRNEANGSVYIEVEGEESLLGQLMAWCRKGPPLSQVTEVRVTEGVLKDFTTFAIRR